MKKRRAVPRLVSCQCIDDNGLDRLGDGFGIGRCWRRFLRGVHDDRYQTANALGHARRQEPRWPNCRQRRRHSPEKRLQDSDDDAYRFAFPSSLSHLRLRTSQQGGEIHGSYFCFRASGVRPASPMISNISSFFGNGPTISLRGFVESIYMGGIVLTLLYSYVKQRPTPIVFYSLPGVNPIT
jgi:hypothetical protein